MGGFQIPLRYLTACSLALAALGARDASAQNCPGVCPPPTLAASSVNAYLSAPGAISDLTSKFLRDNANQAGAGGYGQGSANALGGGADAAVGGGATRPTYRFWSEGYGVRSRTGAQNAFTGDERKTYGGIAGLGVTLPSGWSFGASVDQGHTKISVRDLPQSSKIDLTQIGGNAAYETGAWTFSAAVIHGFGGINSRRIDGGSAATADYDVKLWGTIGEISYYWSSGPWRIVPKIGVDWTHINIDPFTEIGGTIPISATRQITDRIRGFVGAEVGYSWLVNKTLFDIAGYARAVDIFSQDVDSVLASAANAGAALPRLVPGVTDDRFELAAGLSTSVKLTEAFRLYAIYDGRFRDGFTSHAGTLGFEYRW